MAHIISIIFAQYKKKQYNIKGISTDETGPFLNCVK